MHNSAAALLRGALACILAAAAPAVLADQAQDSKQSLSELRGRIEALTKELQNTREAHTEASDALKESERAISDAKRRLHRIALQQAANRKTLQQLQQDKQQLQATIAEQQAQLAAQLAQHYRNGQPGYLQIVLSRQDPNSVARDVAYYGYVARARAQQIARLEDNLGKVEALNARTEATLAEIDALKAEQESQQRQLEAEKGKRQQVMQQLAQQIKSQRSEISRLKRDEKRLTDLVKRLATIVPAKPKHSAPGIVRKNDSLPAPGQTARSFASLKGRLSLPVKGDVLNKYGATREGGGISWKGLFIRAAEGAAVKSIARGTVVFADWLRGFGNLLIIDHGDGYMSLYGNNQALLKQAGEEVDSGVDVAIVGNSGGNADNGLYFELRHRSEPFDPLPWVR